MHDYMAAWPWLEIPGIPHIPIRGADYKVHVVGKIGIIISPPPVAVVETTKAARIVKVIVVLIIVVVVIGVVPITGLI